MNVKEKINKLLSEIEELAHRQSFFKPRDIAEKMSMMSGIGYRDLNTVFTYITGISLLDYIRERQIMAAYEVIISMPIFNIEMAISVSGLDNQSSFGKRFKERFGMTPKEAFYTKDESKIEEQLVWDVITNGKNLIKEKQKSTASPKTRFGIPSDQYRLIEQATNLQSLYEFDDKQSEIAFKIAEQFKVDLKQAFDFVDDYCVYLDYDLESKRVDQDMLMLLFDAVAEVALIYFNVTDKIGAAIDLVGEIKALGYNPLDYTPEFLAIYDKENLYTFKEFLNYASIYEKEHGCIDGYFPEFLGRLKWGEDVEDAINEPDYDKLAENTPYKSDDDLFDEYDDPMLKWINEETDYTNTDRFDDDYDEDSVYYNDGHPFDDFL